MTKEELLYPDFEENTLLPVIVQDIATKDILMMAWMNEEAYRMTLETKQAHYWSRSRQELWHKGATSGSYQDVKEIRIDCDSDSILLLVEQKGTGACHTGEKSCFYRSVMALS